MDGSPLELVKEINTLWEPVYPYLARQFHEIYGRNDGSVLEMGPFGGALFALMERQVGEFFQMAAFPPGMKDVFLREIEKREIRARVRVMETDSRLTGIEGSGFDLVLFRGAFFFPSLFQVHFREIARVLKPRGVAIVGGGFGKYTPETLLREIGRKSRELNLAIGKVEMSESRLKEEIAQSAVTGHFRVTTEGGLWVILKKNGS